MSHILFLNEKHCDSLANLGFSNSHHNLFASFSRSRPEVYDTLHLDEAETVYKTHLNNILPEYCKKWDIKIIQICLMNGATGNPSWDTFRKLKEMGVYLCFHWPDTGNTWGCETIQSLGNIADLNISWDNPRSRFHDTFPKKDNHLFLWVPQDELLYFKEEQTIPVSFIGSPRYYDRGIFINFLKKYYPSVVLRGGQREEKLSPSEYARLIRTSKISLNFSLSPAMYFQTKGRIFEVMASGSMLMEFRNPSTESLFEPGVDYVDFESPEELLEKIQYYTTHEDERLKIANHGHETFKKKYSAKRFWDTIMDRAYSDIAARKDL